MYLFEVDDLVAFFIELMKLRKCCNVVLSDLLLYSDAAILKIFDDEAIAPQPFPSLLITFSFLNSAFHANDVFEKF